MRYDLKAPCANCPFRRDVPAYLHPGRVPEITGVPFACHKTVEHDEDGRVGPIGRESQHCAGALILAEKMGVPHQMMRIAERIGMYDPARLDMTAPVYDSASAMMHACAASYPQKWQVMPPPLRYLPADSVAANEDWGANCGPHALAAIMGRTLAEVRPHLGEFKGWMSPTLVGDALRSMGGGYVLRKGVKTDRLCDGLNRIQWEGSWLNPGVPVAAAYRHTHWVAHFRGFVLCTVVDPAAWIEAKRWRAALAERGSPWHITHHYRIRPPDSAFLAPTAIHQKQAHQ